MRASRSNSLSLSPSFACPTPYPRCTLNTHDALGTPPPKQPNQTKQEYATGGSLFTYVHKQGLLKEAVARWFFQQLVVGIDYCHRRGVANRDIKVGGRCLCFFCGVFFVW